MKIFAPAIILLLSVTDCWSQKSDSSSSGKRVVPWFVERFKLSAGFFYPVSSTSLQVSVKGSTEEGTNIDLNKDLGYNAGIGTFLASFSWRISSRSRINLSYYKINRSTTHTLDRDIVFQDSTYHKSGTVKSFFNNAIYQFSYGYAILSKPNYEAGLLIGVHTVGSKAGISLVGTGGGLSTNNDFGFTAPLPDLGVWGGYAFNKRLAVNLDFDYLSLTVGNISGSILAYNIAFTYKLIEKLDVSVGYTGLNFNLDAEKKDVAGHFDWGYNGPSLTATFSFGKKSWTH